MATLSINRLDQMHERTLISETYECLRSNTKLNLLRNERWLAKPTATNLCSMCILVVRGKCIKPAHFTISSVTTATHKENNQQ